MKPLLQFEIRRTKGTRKSAANIHFSRLTRAFGHLLRTVRNLPRQLRTSDFTLLSRPRLERKALTLVAAASVIASAALAQSNGIPGPQDYAKFSAFIQDRNIFDPNRVQHRPGIIRRPIRNQPAPGIRFVGTMSYAKGMFGFLSGNSAEWSKVVQVGDKFQNFTVTALSTTNLVLEATNHTPLNLALGSGLKQSNGQWIGAEANEIVTGTSTPEATSSSSGSSSGSESPALPPGLENNDILKQMMERRKKENQ
jgi:hypothetical protein